MERLQKVIANSGYTSRRKAEELITKGLVKVNGITVYELGVKVNPSDLIEVDGYIIKNENKVYYLLNKPRGIITSTSDDKGRKTVVDLINTKKRIYPVGRLDYDTTGALILTNDGEFANMIMHPSKKIDKVYVAKVKGIVSYQDIKKLSNGVYIDGVKTSKAKVKLKSYDKKTQTSLVAKQVRLQSWADQIKDCENRPVNMSVDTWCDQHGVSKANYYYRLTRLNRYRIHHDLCSFLCNS